MLDTLKYAKRLQQAGFTDLQAEAQAQALWEAIESTVATKQDLRELETRINGRFNELEARLDGRFKDVEGRFKDVEGRFKDVEGRFKDVEGRFTDVDGRFRLLYWMVGFNLALTVAILLKLLAG